MAGFLGWINTISAILMGSIYPIKKKMAKDKTLVPLYRIVRKIHPPIGILMVVVGGYHGYLMMGGSWRLHSGTLVWLTLLGMGVVAIVGQAMSVFQKRWRLLHKLLAVVMLALLAAHIISPYWLRI
ncbi:hypothetical protein SAMN05192551_105140 [Tindallia magadiensis]|uniref:Cytochrome b561 domain-containing protein n=1 Tax=Tindallia magadiensis TaxID=69895 RepID=A0A1I3ES12_9FIRM|nr:hypothetical protein [Tindallia magadiensis]SFI01728.1 hypothetical protein SAMN05192551_105140 [Tindallia magadiensis]